jgi:ABC-type multidrug transport system permease subunit
MYRPSATFLAQTIGDLPIFFVQIVIFTIIIYFMTGLKYDAGLYFAFLLFTYFVTLAMTAFFRCIGYSFGTFQNASKVSGLMFSILVTVSGRGTRRVEYELMIVRRVHHLHSVNAPLVQLDPMAQPVLLRL